MIWLELISGEPPWSGWAITGFAIFPSDRPIFLEVFEIAPVFVRLDHIASVIVSADQRIMQTAAMLRIVNGIAGRIRPCVP